ncbi:MAG: type II toxin-antitoxin system VapB family antitoxin [Microbacterium sp.]|uniref:type II toxin-antitoxin system VapB family antitoxin n=1 Tax=Microbacterium sp. TaxID=51671 RepID=UPI003A8A6E54
MSLNIKNEAVHDLVRQLAVLTGMSQTSAVEDAVRRRLEELQIIERAGRPTPAYSPEEIERRKAGIRRIVDGFKADTTPEQRAAMSDHGDWLYDETGLPK